MLCAIEWFKELSRGMMKMEINLFINIESKISFDYETIVTAISNYYKNDKCLSLILVDNQEIQKINKEFRNLDYPTDVISFPDEEEDYLGDIFISIDKVIEQAKNYEHSLEREFAFLLIHGILHLLGYDHNNSEQEKIMFEKQEQILNELNFRR